MHHIGRDNFNLHYVLQYFAVTKHADAKEGWAKTAICNFVTKASVDEAIIEFQSSSTYLRASCIGPNLSRHTPKHCDLQKR